MYIQSNYFVLSFDVNSRQTPACALPISLTFRFGTHPHLGSPHFSAYSQLSRLFPLHTRHSAISLLFPTLTKKGGGTPCLVQTKRPNLAPRATARKRPVSRPSAILYICGAMLRIVAEPLLATFCKFIWERLSNREHIYTYTRQ